MLGVQAAYVALYMGAWIEINPKSRETLASEVALYMGAWIEITTIPHYEDNVQVALYMGAWIEIFRPRERYSKLSSHSIWVRGLKSEDDL